MADNQPGKQELIFGKYKSLEEAEKGVQNLVRTLNEFKDANSRMKDDLTRLQGHVEALSSQRGQDPAPRQAKSLVNEEGELDVNALLSEIDNRLAQANQQTSQIPNMVAESVRKMFVEPLNQAEQTKRDFFALPHVPSDFTEAELQGMLRDPSIKQAFDVLASDPKTIGQAYETVLGLWKRTRSVAEPKTGDGQPSPKERATSPQSTGGPDLQHSTDDGLTMEQLREAARRAQDSMIPDHALEVARSFIKGSRLEHAINDDQPDWATEDRQPV